MSKSPNKNSDGALRVSVFSENKAVKTNVFALISVYVYKAVNKIGKAVIVFDAGNMAEADIPESNEDTFAPGKKIKIESGYGNDENLIFEGVVVNHTVLIDGESSTLQIECRDYAFESTLSRKNNVFEKKKDSDAIQEILSAYSDLSASVDATKAKHNNLVQYYCTDWDFVLSRADSNGLVIVTEKDKITIKKPDVSASPKLKVTFGIDVIEFRGELSASDQLADVEARAWDCTTQKTIKVDGKKPTLNKQGTDTPDKLAKAVGNNKCVLQTAISDELALQSWADAQRLKAGLSKIQGYCKFTGNYKAVHGETIEIDGFGKRFNGIAYIGYVEHEIKDGQWITTVGLGLPFENISEKNDVTTPSASGLLPGIEGLHIGKVTKLDGDPTGENKIQVEVTTLNSDKNKVWARLANFWASNNYGAFFIPDVGDEVVLGFFNNDPCAAVVMGSLYSSKQKPVNKLTSDNKIRSITTKSKMKIEFEEEKKIITITTPGKNIIMLSDEDKGIQLTDQNKNKIVMNASGILIESAKGLTLKAKTNIVIDAGANMDAKAKTNVTLKGVNIEANASVALTLKANAKAELTASGQTVIKGAMVMIN